MSAAIAAVAVSLIVLFAGLDLASVSLTEWGIVAVSLFVVSLVWWKTYIPKVPTGRVGLGIVAVTVGWWALALWPVPGNPAWLDRARIVPESGARDEVVDTVEKGGIEGHSDLGLGMTV